MQRFSMLYLIVLNEGALESPNGDSMSDPQCQHNDQSPVGELSILALQRGCPQLTEITE